MHSFSAIIENLAPALGAVVLRNCGSSVENKLKCKSILELTSIIRVIVIIIDFLSPCLMRPC